MKKKWKENKKMSMNDDDDEDDDDDDEEEDNEDDEEEEDDDNEDGDNENDDEDDDDEDIADISSCCNALCDLGCVDSGDMDQHLSSIILEAINKQVHNKINGEYSSPQLELLLNKCQYTFIPTLQMIYHNSTLTTQSDSKEQGVQGDFVGCYHEWAERINCWVHNAFCQSRISELYDCILDYPDSGVAVMELSRSLEVTQLHGKLAVELRQTLKRRLLHPGATTSQIIDIYISTIKVLRLLESSCDGVLDAVAAPLRDYLRERKDCVRKIVTSLTDEEADLYEELQRNQGNEEMMGVGDREEDMEDETVNWKPQLRSDALMKKLKGEVNASSSGGGGKQGGQGGGVGSNGSGSSNNGHKFDILGNLLSIYGSKEVFIDEYRVMLCSRLLKNYNYDTSRDVATLELLKLRFGEAVMYQCEIMIRDIDESKRLNTSIHSKLKMDKNNNNDDDNDTQRLMPTPSPNKGSVLDATVVSEHFWPSLQDNEGIILHPIAAALLDQYNKTYAVMKKPRELKWREQLGLVDLEMEFEDASSLTFSVSPLHATLILHFNEEEEEEDDDDDVEDLEDHIEDIDVEFTKSKSSKKQNKSLTVSELVQLTGLDDEEVKKKMDYWVHEGIVTATLVKRDDDEFEYCYSPEKFPFASSGSTIRDNPSAHKLEDENITRNKDNSKDNKVFRNFVLSMLKNLDSMALERVHNMLKMYTTNSDSKYEMSKNELSEFLNEMILEDLIEFSNGEYKLVSK